MEQAVKFYTRFHNYPYACFGCRKSFKRPATASQPEPVRSCPDCGQPSHYMGKDFKAPRRSDRKAWSEVEAFILSGNIYYQGSQMDLNGVDFYHKREQINEHKRNGFATPSQRALTRRYWADYSKRKQQ